MPSVAPQISHTTVTVEAVKDPNAPSIRQIIRAGLLAKQSVAEIHQRILAVAPESAAAKKPQAHIKWYRRQMRKAGEL